MRMTKAISFTEEYTNEYLRLQKEGNASLLVCELLRAHYNESYGFKEAERDLAHIKVILKDIMQYLEVSKYD